MSASSMTLQDGKNKYRFIELSGTLFEFSAFPPGIHATHFLACLYLVLCFSTTIIYSTSPLKSDLRKTQSLI